MYYPQEQKAAQRRITLERVPASSGSPQKELGKISLIISYLLLVVAGSLWSWPVFSLPAEIIILILAILHLPGKYRRPAIVALVLASVLLVLTLINISVRIYLIYQ